MFGFTHANFPYNSPPVYVISSLEHHKLFQFKLNSTSLATIDDAIPILPLPILEIITNFFNRDFYVDVMVNIKHASTPVTVFGRAFVWTTIEKTHPLYGKEVEDFTMKDIVCFHAGTQEPPACTGMCNNDEKTWWLGIAFEMRFDRDQTSPENQAKIMDENIASSVKIWHRNLSEKGFVKLGHDQIEADKSRLSFYTGDAAVDEMLRLLYPNSSARLQYVIFFSHGISDTLGVMGGARRGPAPGTNTLGLFACA
jgi:hypothetical protein